MIVIHDENNQAVTAKTRTARERSRLRLFRPASRSGDADTASETL
jgi:hypothetical protein